MLLASVVQPSKHL